MRLNKIEAVTKSLVTPIGETTENLSDTHIHLRYMTDEGGWHRASMPIESGNINDLPDLTADEKALVQSICDAACAVPETSNIQRMDFYCSPTHIKMDANGTKEYIPEARFAQVGIRYKNKGNDELKTCDCEVPADAKGFHDACFNHTAGIYAEIHRLMQLKDEPDYQATETIEVTEEVTEVIGDKAVVKKVTKTVEIPLTDEIPCVDEDGDDICDEHGKVMGHKVPRMITGKKVSEREKARLAELLGSL